MNWKFWRSRPVPAPERKEPKINLPRAGVRMYAGAKMDRFTSDWAATGTSADAEIISSLSLLRARSRQLVRDNPHAKRAVGIIQNNVVGQGVGFQARVATPGGNLIARINDDIEEQWSIWCERKTLHTAGLLDMPALLRMAMAQLVEAGEVLLRKIPENFGGGAIPFALEMLEADRLVDQWQVARAPNGNTIRMGVEVDQWGRPAAYWLWPNHPGDYQYHRQFVASAFLRVPAEEVIHLYLIDRWPQTRGVPWFHAVLRRLRDMGGYSEAEIIAARASANIVGFITTQDASAPGEDTNADDNQRIVDTSPGQFQTLLPGESFVGFNPSRPNASLEPFMRYMLREMASGVGVSYESLSRDYSQSNYSSSRLALLDDRDLWRVLQGWLISTCLVEIYRPWLTAAVMAGKVSIPDFYRRQERHERAALFRPRGWAWIDPTKEVEAYRKAVRAGFMTVSDVIALTGGGQDIEDVCRGRRRELDLMAELDLRFDTDPAEFDGKGSMHQESAEEKETEMEAGEGAGETETETDMPERE